MAIAAVVLNPATKAPETEFRNGESGRALDPLLTRQLEREHLQLLELYGQSHLLLSGGDPQGAQHRLGALMVRLRDHARRKESQLYSALSSRHAFDPFIDAVLKEALSLSYTLADIAATHYSNMGKEPENDEQLETMKAQLHGLGTLLTRTIELDASMLFPLYRKALHLEQGLLAG